MDTLRLRESNKEIARLKQALKVFADPKSYEVRIEGDKARLIFQTDDKSISLTERVPWLYAQKVLDEIYSGT